MQRTGVVLAFFLAMLPGMAMAHATPVSMAPDSGENVEAAREISIRFSERLEPGSSRIRVANGAGEHVEQGAAVVGDDPYVLSIPVEAAGEGIYTVSWSVVSKDDGHFTKGAYAFAVGSSSIAAAADSSVVTVKTLPETFAIFVEFIGNSILWGLLVLLLVALKPLGSLGPEVRRLIGSLVAGGIFAGIAGALAQVAIKSNELAALHAIPANDAVMMYLATASGSATLWRMGAIVIFGALFALCRRALYEKGYGIPALLGLCLLVFAYFRSTISHATANPFFPELSVAINVFHLIDKDLWFGVLIVLVALAAFGLRDTLRVIIPRAFAVLAANLALISLTASYIVWLHLQQFSNLSLTEWGENFLMLLAAAVILVALRVYHVAALKWRPALFARFIHWSLALECGIAALVVFYSSLVIITSPPSHEPQPRAFEHVESGIALRLERSPVEDGRALLTIKGEHETPIVRVGEGEGALLAPLEQRFLGGYVMPLPILRGAVEIIVPRPSSYDAHARFLLGEGAFDTPEGHGRTLDTFTIAMIAFALMGSALGLALEFLGRTSGTPGMLANRGMFAVLLGIAIALCVGLFFARLVTDQFGNTFKRLCEADGNMWHMMQPLKAGVAVSKTPREGCMLSSGTYHFADEREYHFLRALGDADVAFSSAPAEIRAGEPATLSFTLRETDGSPAKLNIEHERILHVIIVGEDMASFAHVHPDDAQPLTAKAINDSAFSFEHTFPKGGTYVIATDYLHGLTHASRQFKVEVAGGEALGAPTPYEPRQNVDGYDVEFSYIAPLVGDVATLQYTIRKDGQPVTDLVPYLAAASHVAIVKNDLSEFIHTHGEVHPPGYVAPTTLVGHQHAPPPARFGPIVEAHAVFPSPGLYTVFSEFAHDGRVVQTANSVRIE